MYIVGEEICPLQLGISTDSTGTGSANRRTISSQRSARPLWGRAAESMGDDRGRRYARDYTACNKQTCGFATFMRDVWWCAAQRNLPPLPLPLPRVIEPNCLGSALSAKCMHDHTAQESGTGGGAAISHAWVAVSQRREPWRAPHQLCQEAQVGLEASGTPAPLPLLSFAPPPTAAAASETLCRLAALDQQLGAAAPSSAAQSRGGLPKPCSSASLRQANSSSGGGDSRGGGKRRSSGGGGGGEQRQQQPPEPVYSKLDEAIARGPAADALQLPRPEANSQVGGWVGGLSCIASLCQFAARCQSLLHTHPPFTPFTHSTMQVVTVLLEQLMATNPRAFDARAAIGLKVQDRTVMLDNPGGQRQQQGQRGRRPSRLTAQLASKREQRRQGLYQLQGAGLT